MKRIAIAMGLLVLTMVLLQKSFVTGKMEDDSKTLYATGAAIELACINPNTYKDNIDFSYRIGNYDELKAEIRIQEFEDLGCKKPLAEHQVYKASHQNNIIAIKLMEDAHYYLRAYAVQGTLRTDFYILEIDTRKPTAYASISNAGKTFSGVTYYNDEVRIEIHAKGRNFLMNRLLEANISNELSFHQEGDIAICVLRKEGMYRVHFSNFLDSMGREIQIQMKDVPECFVIDQTTPEVKIEEANRRIEWRKGIGYLQNQEGKRHRIMVTVKDSHFAKSSMCFSLKEKLMPIEISSDTEGTKYLYELPDGIYEKYQCRCEDLAGNVYQITRDYPIVIDTVPPTAKLSYRGRCVTNDSITVSMIEEEDRGSGVLKVFCGLCPEQMKPGKEIQITQDWEGFVLFCIRDRCGNETWIKSNKITVDHQKPIIQLIPLEKEQKIYEKDIVYLVNAFDENFDGKRQKVSQLQYEIKKNGLITQSGELESGQRLIVKSKMNESNQVEMIVKAKDAVGNKSEYKKKYVIDRTAPVIQTEFLDGSPMKKYVNHSRRMRICIKDENLDASSLYFKNMKVLRKKRRKNGMEAIVIFSKAGLQTGEIVCRDKIGHEGRKEIQKFCIDRIAPKIRVVTQIQKYQNRELFLKMRMEDNEGCLLSSLLVEDQGEQIPIILLKVGSKIEGIIPIKREGTHQIRCRIQDYAGNVCKKELEPFVLDFTSPVITVSGVKHKKVYHNKEISLQAEIQDVHLDSNQTKIVFQGGKGELLYAGNDCNQLSRRLREDGVYSLFIIGRDYSGNQSRKRIVFYKNEKGPVISILKKPSGYIRKAGKVIYEVDAVCPIRSRDVRILLMKDNHEQVLDQEDFQIRKEKLASGWMKYQYLLDASKWKREGSYHVAIDVKDTSGINSSDLQTGLEKQCRFVVDSTPPKCDFLNVLEGEHFLTSKKLVRILVRDMNGVRKLQVIINGKCRTLDCEKEEHILEVKANNHFQSIDIRAEDLAGNEVVVRRSLLVTTNQWLYYRDIILIGVAGILVVGMFFLLLIKNTALLRKSKVQP